ncbi:hypothetical protein PI124_g5907 [Phytophthora idaei]|nr:hypothetical protein PI125_g22129 [Phytophthora idaei]KAG3130669.1 hypothetical protein PI126_g20397 [Phytophthora idaei]KAG3249422.1 hypothetical protein PI124_g5907 [Phytophthora idaei]
MEIDELVVKAMIFHGTKPFLSMADGLRRFSDCASEGVVPAIGNRETIDDQAPLEIASEPEDSENGVGDTTAPAMFRTTYTAESEGGVIEALEGSRDGAKILANGTNDVPDVVTNNGIDNVNDDFENENETSEMETEKLLTETDTILRQLDEELPQQGHRWNQEVQEVAAN